ncbi:MAG: hypothetical protein H6508_00460 [Calditrichaeota bacterium]|nr:hypothetical protein [Calditrichota bacterium]MCB9365645.1 hypothetical protein [Calditrichota bacterium]
MKKLLPLVLIASLFVGCLQVQQKTYTYKLNPDGTGTGSVFYYNIHSTDEDERDVSFKDFGTLVTDYLEGTTLEGENEGWNITNKELFEQDGVLCGKIEFSFGDMGSAKLYRTANCECAPILLLPGSMDETLLEHNGGGVMLGSSEVIEWPADSKEIMFKTEGASDTTGARNLVEHYNAWKKTKK